MVLFDSVWLIGRRRSMGSRADRYRAGFRISLAKRATKSSKSTTPEDIPLEQQPAPAEPVALEPPAPPRRKRTAKKLKGLTPGLDPAIEAQIDQFAALYPFALDEFQREAIRTLAPAAIRSWSPLRPAPAKRSWRNSASTRRSGAPGGSSTPPRSRRSPTRSSATCAQLYGDRGRPAHRRCHREPRRPRSS